MNTRSTDPRLDPKLDLNLLRLLVALFETGSVTEAGRRLALSQPAASNALARLRSQLDDELFVRSPGGLRPTALATRLAPAVAEQLRSLADTLRAPADFEPASSTKILRLSLSDLGELTFLPRLIAHLRQAAPGIRVHNHAVPAGETHRALQDQTIDLAIGILPIMLKGLRSRRLFTEPYAALTGPFFPYDSLTAPIFAKSPLVIASPSATQHNDIQGMLKRHGLSNNVVLHAKHYGGIADVVFATDYVAIVPSNYARSCVARMPLTRWPLPVDSPSYEVRMVWHSALDHDPAQGWIRDAVSSLFSA